MKTLRAFRQLPRSIFTKLLVVILVAGVCINLTLGAFFHHVYRKLSNSPLKRNLSQYVHLLVTEMGIPPDVERARRLASEAGLKIWYQGSAGSWSTSMEPPPRIDWSQRNTFRSDDGVVHHLRQHGNFFVRYRGAAGRFTFRLANPDVDAEDVVKGGLFILVALSLTLGLVFFFIRRILKPVGNLTQGVHQVAAGQLNHEVPETGVDEFAQLARAFNQMTARIKKSLESREQLLLDVSHELRSPMTRMRVALEFVPQGKARTSLAEDLAVLEDLVGQILEGARMHHRAGQLTSAPLDLGEAVRTAVAGFAGRRPEIEINLSEGDRVVAADEAKVQTVLSNLLENALKYSGPDSGPVRVDVQCRDNGVEISVRDQGAGIPADDLKHILEPFYRVDKSRTKATGGYGLGLSLCNTIMQAHQGQLHITSQPGEGTTVSLFFPRDMSGR